MPQYVRLYHYTTPKAYYAVTGSPTSLIDKMIHWVVGKPDPDPLKPSMGEGGKDAFHGPGWYMTDIAPGEMSRRDIAIRLWDGGGFNMTHRTECWLSYVIHHSAIVPCNRKYIYLIKATSKAQLKLDGYGWTPEK